ncbi:sodium:solute symporter [Chryseosolibacter indicus]|uniref:Sodium:solute symporter n=1 Tax=Chryseosolibacter indicus TaxID=2782351 RepID=A0ABS5VKF8_9BACT|nr:sodium:solute symporter [Chryseosolibacter indicus]MBT1701923.1 sodium:solute symporter [Chryseosolibacter indicus]
MNSLDWVVLIGTVAFIVTYGTWKTRKTATMEGYLKGDSSLKWWMIGISIMATQASAVTFLSTPGQAIEDGMRFLQFYFGLPIAMVIISVTMVPIYYKLKVYTAYEYLENRFDLKTRSLAAVLFLILRGLSAGITLYAPALVLSTILEWRISITTVIIGSLVIIYVVSGGTKAVSLTQRHQMAVIMSGMILAGILAFSMLPHDVSFIDTVTIAGELGKLNLVNIEFNPNDRYNIWSGLIAGTFLFLSYFGTDQSQVARYLGGASIAESRLGLIFNGLLKIPMQFIILFIGVLVYVFYLFHQPPIFHNTVLKETVMQTERGDTLRAIDNAYTKVFNEKKGEVINLVDAIHAKDERSVKAARSKIKAIEEEEKLLRDSTRAIIKNALPAAKVQDRDYIFLNFVLNNLPHGIIGLLLAVMFSAAMSSMAGELNALASTTTVDIYKRSVAINQSEVVYIKASKWFTIAWAILAMAFAMLASFAENLIQFVNIVGSLFYGTILGIFLTAFYVKYVKGTAVFWSALIAEGIVFYCYFFTDIAFLLYNIIGCISVILISILTQAFIQKQRIA